MIWLWFFLAYAVFGTITYGGTLAYWQSKWPTLAEEQYGEDVAFAVMTAIIPLFWLSAPFVFEFYRYGFQFGRK
jgi:hypothetical protein